MKSATAARYCGLIAFWKTSKVFTSSLLNLNIRLKSVLIFIQNKLTVQKILLFQANVLRFNAFVPTSTSFLISSD
jgi:hypothetical protein